MRIDEIIFKEILNTKLDFANPKDIYTMVAIHYIMNANYLCDGSRMFEFSITPEGLTSAEAIKSIKSKDIKSFDESNVKFSKTAKMFFESLKIAVNKTSKELEIGPKTILIATAGLLFLKNNVMNNKVTDEQIEKCFNKKFIFLSGMYGACEKTLRQFERNMKILKENSSLSANKGKTKSN